MLCKYIVRYTFDFKNFASSKNKLAIQILTIKLSPTHCILSGTAIREHGVTTERCQPTTQILLKGTLLS